VRGRAAGGSGAGDTGAANGMVMCGP
jgi:hypothetical protein